MSDVAKNIIHNTVEEHGGEAELSLVVDAILDKRDVQESTAEFYITNYAEKEKQSDGTIVVTKSEDVAAGEQVSLETSDVGGKVGAIKHEEPTVGRPTNQTFGQLTVLEDVSHPMVPEGFKNSYYRRRVRDKKTDVQLVTRALERGFNVMLRGDTGVGKDALAKHIAENTNRPVYQVNFGQDTRVENLIGHYELVNGSTVWVDGLLTRACRAGGIFLADEINAAGGSVTMPLHSVTEKVENRRLSIPQLSEVIEPHREFRVIGTMNPEYAGTKRQNRAFMNRFLHIELEHISEKRETQVILDNSNVDTSRSDVFTVDKNDNKIFKPVRVVNDLRDDYKNGIITTPISTRELIQVAHYIEDDWMGVEEAMKLIIGGIAEPDDQSSIEKTIETSGHL